MSTLVLSGPDESKAMVMFRVPHRCRIQRAIRPSCRVLPRRSWHSKAFCWATLLSVAITC